MTFVVRDSQQDFAARRSAAAPRVAGVGALVASATLTGLIATPVDAKPLDPRLAAIHTALGRARAVDYITDAAIAPARTFDLAIPAGSIREVAVALEKATGARINLPLDSIGVISSPGVNGTFTLEDALKEMLAGTNVVFRFTGPNAVVLDVPSLSESIDVRGTTSTPVVASPMYAAPLREIPQTIEVIPRAAMEAQGVTTLSEALRNVPGVTLQAGEGGGASSTAGDMFNLRGFSAANSLFVDNVRDDGLIARDVFNVEQVEVFMGPTGSDIGRGTAAGYVNMQTKMPRLGVANAATLTVGTAEQRRATADLNTPLTFGRRDSWLGQSAGRLNLLWQDSGVPGRDYVKNESKAIAPSLALGIGTPTRVTAAALVVRQDNLPDYGIPGAAWSSSLLTPTTVQAARPVDQTNYYGSPDVDYDQAKQHTFIGRVERQLTPTWIVSNQTRVNNTTREAIISTVQNVAAYVPATNLVTIARQGNRRENEIASNQTNLIGRFETGRLEHALSSGLEVIREEQFAPTLAGFGTRAPVDINSPDPFAPVTGFAVSETPGFTRGKTNTVAAYAFDTVQLSSRVQVNGGMRVERYDTAFRSVDTAGVTTVDASAKDGLLSGKAGVLVRLTPEANVYASYGTTVTPPGAANFTLSTAANNQNNPNVEPQRSTNYEVGAKVDLGGGRLLLTAAVFHTINENVIFNIDSAAIPPVFNQDDEQQVDGVTIGATGQVTRNWDVLASVGYLDSKSVSQGSNNGMRLPLSPKWSGSVWTTYRLPKGWTLGGGIRSTDEVFFNTANTIVSPGYTIVDGLLEYAVNAHLSLRVNGYNLTDAVYIRNVNNNGGRYNPGFRRTAQLSSVIRF